MNGAAILNWTIGCYIVLKIVAYEKILSVEPSLRIVFALVPAVLLGWQAVLLPIQLSRHDRESTNHLFSRQIRAGDWWRTFWIIWIGHRPFASDYLLGFFVFSALVGGLVGMIIFSCAVGYARQRAVTGKLVGLLALGYFLLSWEKDAYVEHYGVPVIGHFLERPEYRAKYRVEVRPSNSDTAFEAAADIHVREGTYDYEGLGEDGIARVYTFRDVRLNRLHLPNGGTVTIEQQDDQLRFGEFASVKDSTGRRWRVRLLNQPLP